MNICKIHKLVLLASVLYAQSTWIPTQSYSSDDRVAYQGNICVATNSSRNANPLNHPESWMCSLLPGPVVVVPGIPGPAGPQGETGPQGITGLTGITGATGPSGQAAGRLYYLDPLAPDSVIAGYKQALASPSANSETTIVQSNTGTGDTLIATFITNADEPGVTSLPEGTAFRHFHVSTPAAGNMARLKVELYKRTIGNVETLLRSSYSQAFGGPVQEIIWNFTDTSSHALLATDRIVFKVYTARVSGGGGTVAVTVFFDGVSRVSYLQTTISVGVVGPPGPSTILIQSTDPGCSTTADIGKFWFDNTTNTTVRKTCNNVSGSLTWVTF